MSREAKKAYAAFEKLDAALERIAQIPPNELITVPAKQKPWQ
jgi:hypothetical protein